MGRVGLGRQRRRHVHAQRKLERPLVARSLRHGVGGRGRSARHLHTAEPRGHRSGLPQSQGERPIAEACIPVRKKLVSVDQVVAAEGPRRPSASESQKDFNIGFVYLLEPGQRPGQQPSSDLLDAHAQFAQTFVEHWFQITGGRSG